MEEARSLIKDGYIPQVRAIACNNGLKWNQSGEEAIQRARQLDGFNEQVTWEHINHEGLVKILQASKPVNDTLRLSGKAIVEDMEFSRVLIGRISVTEIAELIERHGERLLERNIRRYLGLQGNQINEGIRDTLNSDENNNFYFYNNGITLFLAMQMGQKLLADMNIQIKDISHQNFADSQRLIKQNAEAYFNTSLQDIKQALQDLYGTQEISLQQLSATFRRGDLISKLE